MALEGGGLISDITIAYETWGELEPDASNAVLVCHALTGDSHAHGAAGRGHPTPGWWNGMIGPGAPIDTDKYFVVCVNVIGGCQGSTGPSSVNPDTGSPYGLRFPVVSIRDIVRTQAAVADHLGIQRWLGVVGGSMGGMQALEWAITYPRRLRSTAVLASTVAASAQQIAWSMAGRRAIQYDPRFRGGDYYDAPPDEGPHSGLMVARSLAMIHYRSDAEFERRFGRETEDELDEFTLDQRFEVERYLDYQGEKLARRFDANSYVLLNKAMDLHDVGRGRGGVRRALERIRVPVLVAGITSDFLYPLRYQYALQDELTDIGIDSEFVLIDSEAGHDGFLVDHERYGDQLADFFARISKQHGVGNER